MTRSLAGDPQTRLVALLATIILLTTALPGAVANHPALTGYDDLQQEVDAWRQEGVQVSVPETSLEGRDIYMVEMGEGPVTVLLINELHADEPASTDAFVDLVWALLGDTNRTFEDAVFPGLQRDDPVVAAFENPDLREELLDRVTIVGFPMIEPDGAENGHSGHGIGNVDYRTQVTPQAQAIRHAVETHDPDVMLDNHGTSREDTELRVGLMEAQRADEDVTEQTRVYSETMWRAASAIGVDVDYYEERPFNETTWPTDEPVQSTNAAYWDALTRFFPVSNGGYALEGIPSLFTEVKDFRGDEAIQSVLEGASIQEVVMAGLLLDVAGFTTGDAPVARGLTPGLHLLDLPAGTTDLTARISWDQPGQDYTLTLRGPDGEVVAQTGPDPTDPVSLTGEARALYVPGPLDGGTYTLDVDPRVDRATAVDGKIWYQEPDPGTPSIDGLLDEDADVEFSNDRHTLYDTLYQNVSTLG